MSEQNNSLEDFVVEVIEKDSNSERELPLLPELEKLPAKVKSLSNKTTKSGERILFCFELEGDYEGRHAWGSVPKKFKATNDSDLMKWVVKILGKELSPGLKFKLGKLIGKRVYIIIENSENVDENGKPYQNVTKLATIDGENDEETTKTTTKKKTTTTTKKKKAVEEDVEDILEESVSTGEEEEEEVEEEPTTNEEEAEEETPTGTDDDDDSEYPF